MFLHCLQFMFLFIKRLSKRSVTKSNRLQATDKEWPSFTFWILYSTEKCYTTLKSIFNYKKTPNKQKAHKTQIQQKTRFYYYSIIKFWLQYYNPVYSHAFYLLSNATYWQTIFIWLKKSVNPLFQKGKMNQYSHFCIQTITHCSKPHFPCYR